MKSCFLLAVWTALSLGQPRPACTEFEVASVKPAPPLDTSQAVAFGRQIDSSQVRFTQTSIREFIRIAWAVKDYQIEAPAWLASERLNVSAKLLEGCTQQQVPAMLQALLSDRFSLKLHRAFKDLPVYAIVVRAGGPKIKESQPDEMEDRPANAPEQVTLSGAGGRGGSINYGGGSFFAFPHYRMQARKLPMDLLASLLIRMTDRPVVDQTGLSRRYDFDLPLDEDDYDALMIRAAASMGEIPSPKDLRQLAAVGDPLPRVLRSLGLDLKPTKGRVDVLVIDVIRKNATEN